MWPTARVQNIHWNSRVFCGAQAKIWTFRIACEHQMNFRRKTMDDSYCVLRQRLRRQVLFCRPISHSPHIVYETQPPSFHPVLTHLPLSHTGQRVFVSLSLALPLLRLDGRRGFVGCRILCALNDPLNWFRSCIIHPHCRILLRPHHNPLSDSRLADSKWRGDTLRSVYVC